MPDKLPEFSKRLLKWYREHKRDLPWRSGADPYRVWLSEIILQQTRVDQGMPYYLRFTERFPDVHALAAASTEEVLKLWQGLGYYSRARNLHETAIFVSGELEGKFPDTYQGLLALKGVGPYTASAIASICFDRPRAVVDGNVYRVLARLFGVEEPVNSSEGKQKFANLADDMLDSDAPGTYNQAIMEFGATWCKPAKPLCEACIFSANCEAKASGRVDVLPVKVRKTRLRKRYFNYLVMLDEHSGTRLKKRQGRDIWEQLYDFPLIESQWAISVQELSGHPEYQDLTARYEVRSLQLYNEVPLLHKLSHQHLHLSFWIVELAGKDWDGLPVEEIGQYPVPVPIRNFISEFPAFQ